MGGAQHQLIIELKIAIVLSIFCIAATKADSKIGKVNWRGTLIIKAVAARNSHIRNYIVQCCGRNSCSSEDYYDDYENGVGNSTGRNSSTKTKIASSNRKVKGKGGLSNNKNKVNGKRPGNGRNYKNSLGGGRGKVNTKNKNRNSNPKGVGGSKTRGGQGSSGGGGSSLGSGTASSGGSNLAGGNAGSSGGLGSGSSGVTGGSGTGGPGTGGSGTGGSSTRAPGAGGTGVGGMGVVGTGAGDSGAGDLGAGDSGAEDSGAGDSGAGDSGAEVTGAGGTAGGATGAGGTGAGGTGYGGTGAGGTGAGGTGATVTANGVTGAGGTGAGGTGTGGTGAGGTGAGATGAGGTGATVTGAGGTGAGGVTTLVGDVTTTGISSGTGATASSPATGGSSTGGASLTGTTSTTAAPSTTGTTVATRPPCPTVCAKNSSWFEADGALKMPHTHGVWMEKCGRTYMLGNYLGRYERAWDYCCGLGMTPLSFETVAEQTCFGAMVTKTWPYNQNYWTAGKGMPGNYSWCGASGEVPIVKENIWDLKQPDFKWRNQYCVHLKLYKDTSKALLTDRNCTDWFVIACEGPPTPAPTTAKPNCPPLACAKDTSKFDFLDKTKLSNPSNYGVWKEICGRVYLFGPSTAKKNWADTRKLCCSIGMKPFGIESFPEQSCLVRQSFFSKNIWGTFWTGGTDQQLEGQFIWCGSNKTFNDTQFVWKPGQPDNAGGNDNCVSTVIANKSVTIEDSKCDATNQYICETRSSAKAPGSAMQEECAAYFSLTQAEIDTILNGTSRKYNVKCFMKCMGESMEIYKDGQLIEDATFKLIEEVSQSDEEQIQKDTETYFDCRTRRGADECETAEAIFDCGQKSENSSKSVAAILVAVETNATAEKAPVPCVQPDCGGPCSPDPVKLNYLATNTVPASDGVLQTICGKQYLIGKMSNIYSWPGAKSFCCSYGMQMIALETLAEKTCVSTAISGTFWSGATFSGCPGFGYQWCYSNEPVDYSVVFRPPLSPSIGPCFYMALGGGNAGVTEGLCVMPYPAACESY